MNVDSSRRWRAPVAPDVLQQRASRYRLAAILDKIAQQPRLALRQRDPGPLPDQFRLAEIHASARELVGTDLLFLVTHRTYEQRLDPHLQLIDIHRLDQAVIGARSEYSDAMLDLIASHKHHDRRFDIPLAQLSANVHGIDPAFGMVDNDKVE